MIRNSILRWLYIILPLPIIAWIEIQFNLYDNPFAPFFIYLILPLLFFPVWEAYVCVFLGLIMENYFYTKSATFHPIEEVVGIIEVIVFSSVIIGLGHLLRVTKKQSEEIRVLERQKALRIAQEEYQRKREEFLVIAAHELKTPVTVIVLYADLLNSKYKSLSEVDVSTDNILKESRHITTVINDILAKFEPNL